MNTGGWVFIKKITKKSTYTHNRKDVKIMMNANEIRSAIRTLGLTKSKIQEAGISEDRLDFILSKPTFMSQSERVILERVINETKTAKVQIVPASDEDPRSVILQKMKDYKISVKHLSEVSGLAYTTVSDFVHGTRTTSKRALSAISENVDKIIERAKQPSPLEAKSSHYLEKISDQEAAKDEKVEKAVEERERKTVYKRFDDSRRILVITFNDGSYLELFGLLNGGVRGTFFDATLMEEKTLTYDSGLDNKVTVRKMKAIRFLEIVFKEIGLSVNEYLDEIGTIAGL